MNQATSRLLCLRQGNRAIEEYVEDFCGLCHLVDFNDIALKELFRYGLDEPICSGLPGGKIHWTLETYIDYALRLSGSPLTVGIAEEGPCNPTVAPHHNQFTSHLPSQSLLNHSLLTPCLPLQGLLTPCLPLQGPLTPCLPLKGLLTARPESASVMAALLQPAHKMAAIPEPVHKMAAIPEPVHKMTAIPEPVHKMAAIPKSVHKMAAIPKPVHKMATVTKPVHKMAAPSESLAKMAATPEPHQAKIISSASHPIISATPK
ncbi:hypothetical protein M9458_013040, partial [Cirrhinus mrigala]